MKIGSGCMKIALTPNTYGFRLKGDFQETVAGLQTTGYEIRQHHDYRWDGLQRAEQDVYIFQYTLSGKGAIRIGQQYYELRQGDAFFMKVPSDHCYYLPHDSEQWEFLYFTIYGNMAATLFEKIQTTAGPIIQLPLHAAPIQFIIETLEKIENIGIHHGYESSARAYTFVMKCLEYLEYGQRVGTGHDSPINKAIRYIEKYYYEDLSLDDVVAVTQLSKYYFTRQFNSAMKVTPIQYLTQIRIRVSVQLLITSELSVAEIATRVGFRSSNYFSKVFKKVIGVTPGSYRKNNKVMPVDKLFID